MNGSDDYATRERLDPDPSERGPAVGTTDFDIPSEPATGSPYADPLRASIQSGPRPRRAFGFTVPPAVQDALTPLNTVGKQYLAWIGSGLLLLSLFFLPAKTYSFSVATFGGYSGSTSQSLWDYGTFWGVILLLLALASIGLAYIRDYQWLVITGGVAFLILVLNFLYAFSGILGFSAHPSWGWIILFPSALIIMAAGAMRSTPRDAENSNGLSATVASIQNRNASR